MTRYTLNSDVLEQMIATVERDTDEFVNKPGEEGCRGRAVKLLYPVLIRWLASEVDMQTVPGDVAIAFADSVAILVVTVLHNVTDSQKSRDALEYMIGHIKDVALDLMSQAEFKYTPLDEAGEG